MILRFLVFVFASALGTSCSGGSADVKPEQQVKGFAVLALSRGAGVPKSARDVLNQVQSLLDKAREGGADIAIVRYRIGLEGETKLCAEFTDPVLGGQLLAQAKNLSQGVDLVNVEVKPCGKAQ